MDAVKSARILRSPELDTWLRNYQMAPLAHAWLQEQEEALGIDDVILNSIRKESYRHSILEESRAGSLRELCDALHAEAIPFLFFKGTALAYSAYDHAYLRPRADSDLLIRDEDLNAARAVFQALGYEREITTAGELVSYQEIHARNSEWGAPLTYDLHWKICNPQLFAGLFSFAELWDRSIPLPLLHERACGPSPADSLLIACVHRVAHHYDEEDPLAIFDIHLLAEKLNEKRLSPLGTRIEDGWEPFLKAAKEKQVAKICARGLKLARKIYGSDIPASVIVELDAAKKERSSAFLRKNRRWMHDLYLDFKVLPGWGARARLLKEHLFPPAAFMKQKYGLRSSTFLPIFYMWRPLAGAGKIFRKFG